jgi:hypothetical protein
MAWKIEFQRPAERDLEKLNPEAVRRILGFLHNRLAKLEDPSSEISGNIVSETIASSPISTMVGSEYWLFGLVIDGMFIAADRKGRWFISKCEASALSERRSRERQYAEDIRSPGHNSLKKVAKPRLVRGAEPLYRRRNNLIFS